VLGGLEHLPDAVTALLQVEGEDTADPAGRPREVDEDTHVDLAPVAGGDADNSRVREFAGSSKTSPLAEKRTRRPAPTSEELTTLLERFSGSVAQVARHLDRQYAVVWRCIQRYGIDANTYRPGTGQRSE